MQSTRPGFFSEQWDASVTACCGALERSDARRLLRITTQNDAQAQFPKSQDSSLQSVALQEFAMLYRRLDNLGTFMEFVSDEAIPKIQSNAFWGAVGLGVKLAQDQEELAIRVPHMLRDICHRIEILNRYWTETSTLYTETKEACFEVALALLSFVFAVIMFIREDREYSSADPSVWKPLEQRSASVSSEINDAISRLEKLSRIAQRSGLSDQADLTQLQSRFAASRLSTLLPPEEECDLPCFMFPTSRTLRFFDRTDVGIQIDNYFGKELEDSSSSFQSLALYGLGGVGKSCVALKYAETRRRRNDIDAMFWVSSEKEVSMRQSFTNIALKLKLPNAEPKDHDENRTLVLDWLQTTKSQWLIVYDNVESLDLLLNYWPDATHGQALITTRNRNFAFDPADGGLEITTWDAETGSQFLLHLLSTDISARLTSHEITSAHKLSINLSGHALAISHMAGLMYRRSWSISEFLDLYEKMPEKVHGVSGNRSINAIWELSFKSLSDESRTILGIMAFLAPDSIPQALFEVSDPACLPESLKFCVDPFMFSEHIETLLTVTLVKRDREQRAYSIHRLVQSSFKHFMTAEQRQQCFNDASILVASAFPRKDTEFAQLYHMWKPCSLYLQHVLSLRDFFREELASNARFAALKLYCELNNACQRYLLEINGYNDNLILFEVNALAMKTIPEQAHSVKVDLEGELASHKGQLLGRIGLPEKGIECLRLSYQIFATDEPYNPRESAWCAENLANGFATANDWLEAIKWQNRAREHWLDFSKKESADREEWPAILKKSMGTTLLWAGEVQSARTVLTQGIKQVESTQPYNWATAAYIYYELGNLDRLDRRFELAESRYMEAQNKWLTGHNLRSDPFNGAIMYRLGCAALDQGKVEVAIKHLRDAMVVTERHKVTMIADHARTLFKLSEALVQEERAEQEAYKLRDDAERLLLMRNPKAKSPGLEKTYDDLVCILWR